MSHYRCTPEGRADVRWWVAMVRQVRTIVISPADPVRARLNLADLPYFEARLRAVLIGRMVWDVVQGGTPVFTTGCELTAGRYAQLTPGSRLVCRPNVETVPV